MATKVSMKKSNASKSKVKKYDGTNLTKIQEAFWQCTDEEQSALDSALSEYVDMSFDSFLDDLLFNTANILDGVGKSKKSMSTAQMIRALKSKGYKVSKGDEEDDSEDDEDYSDLIVDEEDDDGSEAEETPTEEESEEEEEETDEEDDDVEVEVEVEKSKSLKSAYELFKKKGWIGKTNDDGINSEELERGAIGSEAVAKVPETPEPKENVQQTATGVPEDAPEPESEDNDEVTEQDGNDLDALEPESENNQSIATTDADDIEALINKKRDANTGDAPASYQPFANNYRTVQRGEGKMPMSAVIPTGRQRIGKKRI